MATLIVVDKGTKTNFEIKDGDVWVDFKNFYTGQETKVAKA